MSSSSSKLGTAESPSSYRKKPSLVVVGEGGAIASEIQNGARVPTNNAINHLLSNIPDELRKQFSRIRMADRGDTELVLSSDATTERIEQFAALIRRLAHGTKQNILALVGTHAAPKYASAVSEALCTDDMKVECRGEARGRSILLASSRNTSYDTPTDAFDNMNDAVELSAHPEMQGRAGLVFQGKVNALPGLQRTGEPTQFASRFPAIAHRDSQSGDWYFSEGSDSHMPMSACGEKFRLQHGVESFDISGEPESALAALTSAADAGLQGMVLRTRSQNSSTHIRPDNEKLLRQIDNLGVPGIVVCDTLHKNGNGQHPLEEPEYPFNNIFDGEGLLSAEAEILLARWIALAKDQGFVDSEDVSGYVMQMLDAYDMK